MIKFGLNEPVISDTLVEELGIIIVHAKGGSWEYVKDSEDKLRPGARPWNNYSSIISILTTLSF